MATASQFLLGFVGIAVGIFLLWYGMPDRRGHRPRFMTGEVMEMLYPVLVLAFLVLGGTSILTALF